MERATITESGICPDIVAFIYKIDQPINLFPSIHCLESWICFRGSLNRNRDLIGQREVLQLSMETANNKLAISKINHDMSSLEKQISDVAEGVKDVVTKSELADMMNSFVSEDDDKWLMYNAKFKASMQDKIGATVDTTNLEIQYDKIYEIEEFISDLKAQIRELKKDQVNADSIYEFLFAFRDVYSECNEAEKKQFMQAFIDRIDIFPERREDGNWIRNIRFNFPVPIIREGKETIQVKGITLEKESVEEGIIPLEKLTTVETVVLLSRGCYTSGDVCSATTVADRSGNEDC